MLGLTNNSTFDEVAKALFLELRRRGYGRISSVAVAADGIQESQLKPTIWSPNHLWYGIFQQDAYYLDRMNPNMQIIEFLNRLDKKIASPGASPDIWKNIFWLQQRPGEPTAEAAYANGRKAYLTEIQRKWAEADKLYDQFLSASPLLIPGVEGLYV